MLLLIVSPALSPAGTGTGWEGMMKWTEMAWRGMMGRDRERGLEEGWAIGGVKGKEVCLVGGWMGNWTSLGIWRGAGPIWGSDGELEQLTGG